jgi:hypothetical protein
MGEKAGVRLPLINLSMKKVFYVSLVLFAAVLLLYSCRSEMKPAERHGRLWVEHHFSQPEYKGLIQVADVELIEISDGSYLGAQFREVKMGVTINVSEDFMISKLFMNHKFQVNENWPLELAARLENATDQDEKDKILNDYKAFTFSRGEHMLQVKVDYALIEDRWVTFNANIIPLDLILNPRLSF